MATRRINVERFSVVSHKSFRDAPATFLYPEVLARVAHRRIRGLDRSPYPGDLTWCMDQLWLEEQS